MSVTTARIEKPEPEEPAWSYEGESGPSDWSNDYPECAGSAQSPIDVRGAEEANLEPIEFTYLTVGGVVRDTGRIIQVDSEGGTLKVGDRQYTLLRLQFHVPSEHTIEGRRFDAVLDLVHVDADSQLAVVSLQLVVGDENEFVGDVLDQLALHVDERGEVDVEDLSLDDSAYYTYVGSLTMPPCSEGVRWIILSEPATLSEEQLEALAGYHENNHRPEQPLNNRTIRHAAR